MLEAQSTYCSTHISIHVGNKHDTEHKSAQVTL